MPFRNAFECLWCGARMDDPGPGRPRRVRPALSRLHRASRRERLPPLPAEGGPRRARARPVARAGPGAAASAGSAVSAVASGSSLVADTRRGRGRPATEMVAYYEARAGEYDDWYLRRGRYDRGPLHDQAWAAELDGATLWLDGLPCPARSSSWRRGPVGGARCWRRRESCRSTTPPTLRSIGHASGCWPTGCGRISTCATPGSSPTARSTGVFAGFWLSHVPRDRLAEFLGFARRWLKPGGTFAFIDSRPDPQSGADDQPPPRRPRRPRHRSAPPRRWP